MAFGPAAGLTLLDQIDQAALRNYAPVPAARGDFLFRAGRLAEARAQFEQAAALSRNERDERPSYMIQWMITMLFEVVLGILAAMIVAWFSRHREFRADKGGAQLAGRESMVGALRRLMSTKELVDPQAGALASFKIAGGGKSWMLLFASHPPLEERIAALERGV